MGYYGWKAQQLRRKITCLTLLGNYDLFKGLSVCQKHIELLTFSPEKLVFNYSFYLLQRYPKLSASFKNRPHLHFAKTTILRYLLSIKGSTRSFFRYTEQSISYFENETIRNTIVWRETRGKKGFILYGFVWFTWSVLNLLSIS